MEDCRSVHQVFCFWVVGGGGVGEVGMVNSGKARQCFCVARAVTL